MRNIRNIIYGFLEIVDGMIMILSLGFITTSICMWFLTWWMGNIEMPSKMNQMKDE